MVVTVAIYFTKVYMSNPGFSQTQRWTFVMHDSTTVGMQRYHINKKVQKVDINFLIAAFILLETSMDLFYRNVLVIHIKLPILLHLALAQIPMVTERDTLSILITSKTPTYPPVSTTVLPVPAASCFCAT